MVPDAAGLGPHPVRSHCGAGGVVRRQRRDRSGDPPGGGPLEGGPVSSGLPINRTQRIPHGCRTDAPWGRRNASLARPATPQSTGRPAGVQRAGPPGRPGNRPAAGPAGGRGRRRRPSGPGRTDRSPLLRAPHGRRRFPTDRQRLPRLERLRDGTGADRLPAPAGRRFAPGLAVAAASRPPRPAPPRAYSPTTRPPKARERWPMPPTPRGASRATTCWRWLPWPSPLNSTAGDWQRWRGSPCPRNRHVHPPVPLRRQRLSRRWHNGLESHTRFDSAIGRAGRRAGAAPSATVDHQLGRSARDRRTRFTRTGHRGVRHPGRCFHHDDRHRHVESALDGPGRTAAIHLPVMVQRRTTPSRPHGRPPDPR